MKPQNPILVCTIKLQPKTGMYSLRDATDCLIGVFNTFADAEKYASERFDRSPKVWRLK